MRRLLPDPLDRIEPFDAYGDPPAQWLRVGMVMSLDGSVTDEDGWSDRLGGRADLRVFRTLRALSDGIIVGAATIRTGRVGPHRPTGEWARRRAALGKPAPSPIIVVSGSLRLDWSHRLFTAAVTPTIVVTHAAAATQPVPDHVRLVVAGTTEVDLPLAIDRLRHDLGLRHLLCEGGPALTTGMIASGLADELCLNIAPTLLGAGHHTPPLRELTGRVELRLTALYEDGGTLLARYRRQDR